MKINLRAVFLVLLTCVAVLAADAQKFYNLTAQQVRVDSVVPVFSHSEPLGGAWRDSTYNYEIAYPEFADMPVADAANYRRLVAGATPQMPEVETRVTFDRKRPSLTVNFCPVVERGGRLQVLASFMLRRVATARFEARQDDITARIARLNNRMAADASAADVAPADRYAAHSVLREGRWVKIRVSESGIHQLTSALLRQAGFSNPDRVKIYGYGGNLRSETLSAADIIAHDDLSEVPTCEIGGRRLFHALGPVSWANDTTSRRTRNCYSDYGYYFLTDDGTEPTRVDSVTFVSSFYPSADYHHDLYEVDGYSWYNGGRNLFDTREVRQGDSLLVNLSPNPAATEGWLSVNVSSANYCSVQVSFNDSIVGTLVTNNSNTTYIFGCQRGGTFRVPNNALAHNVVKLSVLEGSNPMRLDYVSMAWDKPFPLPDMATATFPVPQYVYSITNQDHHADPQADMVIIIPTSQKLLAQAQRLKAFHEQRDGMRVNIVPADELYNEFSSGTPDASAYRLYMKMLYDRAQSEADMPKHLVLFGDCLWDNRLITPTCSRYAADDLLLAFESENSFDKRSCYIDDGFFCMLDDGEGTRPLYADKLDVAVGRFPVATAAQAKIMIDKTIAYDANSNGGAWQNTILFMGDDGDNNLHMNDANTVADQVVNTHPEYVVKKIMWDTFRRESAASGFTYPDVTKAIKQQQQQGALIMDYAGHGSEIQLSHEKVLRIDDFAAFSNSNLPLWVTASCDIMPFDGVDETIGETAVLNEKGGAVAFYGTTRTVYASYNTVLNSAFMRHVLSYDTDGQPLTLGEAQRRAKNESVGQNLAGNSLQYSLLGDPALRLHLPTAKIMIDSIGGIDVSSGQTAQMKAGSKVKVTGRVVDQPQFDGTVTLTVRDNLETVTCRLNDTQSADTAFVYTDRTKTIFRGSARVNQGRFGIEFAVPKDINYSNLTGLINAFAVDDAHTLTAHGCSSDFTVGESDLAANDSIGPSVYCYLNSPSFQNGGRVNSTPYFVAEIRDRDGINASGAGIGHDMQLVIDGDMDRTYSLNDNFQFDFGSYTSGSTYYNIPQLSEGGHRLQFRAWDILNNVTVAELQFRVDTGLKPSFTISCTDNPARESTTFIIAHDRTGSNVDVELELFDMSGRLLWRHDESGVSDDSVYTVSWDLTVDGGSRLQTGVYLYRVRLTSDGGTRMSKAKKLVVIGNK